MRAPFVRLFWFGRTYPAVELAASQFGGRRKRRDESRRGKGKDMSPGMATRHVLRRAPRVAGRVLRPASQLQVCCAGSLVVPFFVPCLTLGCRRMPVSLRADSSLADPSLAFGALNRVLKMEGPPAPIVPDLSFLPREEQQGGALQTFLHRRKESGAVRFCRSQHPTGFGTRNRPDVSP